MSGGWRWSARVLHYSIIRVHELKARMGSVLGMGFLSWCYWACVIWVRPSHTTREQEHDSECNALFQTTFAIT
eukprot:1779771-Amphidinium_carterae.1